MESTASIWEDPHCPFRVEWAPDQLNQMRIAVVDAFYALPRGGIEIGGVLVGRMDGKVVRIDSFAPMECEHLTGPSFVLSPKDEAALQSQLAGLGNQVVGWFHSHTRSEIHFSPQDSQLHDRFFPKAAQIAMVLRPANSQPPRANYFFRGPGGVMNSGANSFVVEPIRSKTASVTAAVAPPAPTAPPVEEPIPVKTALPEPPVFLREREMPPRRNFLWPAVGLVVLALCVAAFFLRDIWMPK